MLQSRSTRAIFRPKPFSEVPTLIVACFTIVLNVGLAQARCGIKIAGRANATLLCGQFNRSLPLSRHPAGSFPVSGNVELTVCWQPSYCHAAMPVRQPLNVAF